MQNDILSLQETSENTWQAKYLGNYGTYNIKIFKNIGSIEGGKEMAKVMIAQYKIQYKSRRAMVEVLGNVKF